MSLVDVFREMAAENFLERQTVEGVRFYIRRGTCWDFRYAVELMDAWAKRRPRDKKILKMLKAELLARQEEVRVVRAGYARTYRGNLRAKRTAADARVCEVCGSSLAGKRADAKTCSTRCRVAMSRDGVKFNGI